MIDPESALCELKASFQPEGQSAAAQTADTDDQNVDLAAFGEANYIPRGMRSRLPSRRKREQDPASLPKHKRKDEHKREQDQSATDVQPKKTKRKAGSSKNGRATKKFRAKSSSQQVLFLCVRLETVSHHPNGQKQQERKDKDGDGAWGSRTPSKTSKSKKKRGRGGSPPMPKTIAAYGTPLTDAQLRATVALVQTELKIELQGDDVPVGLALTGGCCTVLFEIGEAKNQLVCVCVCVCNRLCVVTLLDSHLCSHLCRSPGKSWLDLAESRSIALEISCLFVFVFIDGGPQARRSRRAHPPWSSLCAVRIRPS